MKSEIKNDSILKHHLKKAVNFVDIFNAAAFNGNSIIDGDSIELYESEMTGMVDSEVIKILERRRDVIFKWGNQGFFALIAIENQKDIDDLMAFRELAYEFLAYNQQYENYKEKLKNKENNEKKEKLKLMPVMTLVINWGEKRWEGPKDLLALMEVPEYLDGRINNWKLNIIDVIDFDYHLLKEEDNYKLIKAIQLLYQYKGDKERLKGMTVSKEVLLILASLTASENLREIAIEAKEGEEIEMCEALDRFRQQNIEFGRKEGVKKGTKFGAQMGVKTGMSKMVIDILSNQMELSDETKLKIISSSKEQLHNLANNFYLITSEADLIRMLSN